MPFSFRDVQVVPGADDDMVQQFDRQQDAGEPDVPGDFGILGAGVAVARRVVVSDHDGGRVGHYGGAQYLRWPDRAGVHRADIDGLLSDNLVAGVRYQHDQVFLQPVLQMRTQDVGGIGWAADKLRLAFIRLVQTESQFGGGGQQAGLVFRQAVFVAQAGGVGRLQPLQGFVVGG